MPTCPPTFVNNTPVVCSIHEEEKKVNWDVRKAMKIYSEFNLKTCPRDRMKNVVENESQPWSNNCPKGELDFVLLACFPSIASKVEYVQTAIARKIKQ